MENKPPEICPHCRVTPTWMWQDGITWECSFCHSMVTVERKVIVEWKAKAERLDVVKSVANKIISEGHKLADEKPEYKAAGLPDMVAGFMEHIIAAADGRDPMGGE